MKINLCKTIPDFKKVLSFVKSQTELVIDLETRGLEPHNNVAKILSCAVGYSDTVFAFPVGYGMDSDIYPDEVDKIFKEIVKKKIIGHNLKYEYRWLSSYKHKIKHFHFDTILAHSLLDENSPHDLEYINSVYLPEFGGYKINFQKGLKDKHDYETAELDQLLIYNAKDVVSTGMLRFALEKELRKDDKLWWIFNNYTMKNVLFLSNMEENGFCIDKKIINYLDKEYTNKIDSHEVSMKRALSRLGYNSKGFNFTSYVQLRKMLYDFMEFPVIKKTKLNRKTGGGGNPATDEEALKIMRNDRNGQKYRNIIDSLIKRQQIFNIRKSFVYPIQRRLGDTTTDSIIRTTFNQHIVETGRLSSSGINFQNFPTKWKMKSYDITPVKKCIVSRFKNGKILQGDYSQIELRTAGMYSEDPIFVNAFNEGKDLHGELAEYIYGKDYDGEQRKKAKTTNFSAIFEITAETLADDLGIDIVEADKLLRGFRKMHPVLYSWFRDLWHNAKHNGYARNFMGRKRRIGKDLEKAEALWQIEAIKRQVWNYPIQSTAVELTLTSMRILYEEMQKNGMKSLIIANVHDSIIIDCVRSETRVLPGMMKQIFEKDVVKVYKDWNWNVPLRLDISVGDNMNDLDEL